MNNTTRVTIMDRVLVWWSMLLRFSELPGGLSVFRRWVRQLELSLRIVTHAERTD